jgi:hypothetical protein
VRRVFFLLICPATGIKNCQEYEVGPPSTFEHRCSRCDDGFVLSQDMRTCCTSTA